MQGVLATVMVTAIGAAVAAVSAKTDAGNDVVTKVGETDRAAAVAYWTPERIGHLADEDGLPPAETIAKKWTGPLPAGVGRLFLTAEPGGDESCSATVVPSATGDVAFTAGHCVDGGLTRDDTPVRITNLVFAPGFADGQPVRGIFPARAFAWPDTYQGPTSSLDDDAVIAVDPVDGKHVAAVAGTQNISFDAVPSPVAATIAGYPVSKLTGGGSLVSCSLPVTLESNSAGSAWRSGCDMAGGSSGGPWLRDVDPATGQGTIFAVTSSGGMNEDGTTTDLNAAMFTGAVRGLYERAGGL